MKAVLAEVPESLLEERRRLGLDRYDEMWAGVMHLAAAPRRRHQRVVAALIAAVHEPATREGLTVEDGINVCNPARPFDDYRIPDLVVVEPNAPTVGDDFGVTTGVSLAVEVRSPREDAEAKLAFYAARRIAEVLVIDVSDPSQPSVQHLRLTGGSYSDVTGEHGEATVFGVRIVAAPGAQPAGLRIEDARGRRFL